MTFVCDSSHSYMMCLEYPYEIPHGNGVRVCGECNVLCASSICGKSVMFVVCGVVVVSCVYVAAAVRWRVTKRPPRHSHTQTLLATSYL